MVMMIETHRLCINKLKENPPMMKSSSMTPHGNVQTKKLQSAVDTLKYIILCGHYKGVMKG